MTLSDFVYQLPPELIAQDPVVERDSSRLLNYSRQNQAVTHCIFHDIVSILEPSDVLVVNNTQVIPVRLIGRKASGGSIEIFLVKQEAGRSGLWQAMAKYLKKLNKGDVIHVAGQTKEHSIVIEDIFVAGDGQKRLLVRLTEPGNDKETFDILQDAGKSPLPPYIVQARRNQQQESDTQARDSNDLQRYQTVFAKYPGAIAAPTAGLHFSASLLEQLKDKGVLICEVTLHVGPGTFKPITTSIEDHVVEAEWFTISKSTAESINSAKKQGRRVIAVGTTSCRALETAAEDNGELQPIDGSYTSLFIKPGYKFKVIDGLLTNFHLSQSSLLLLVAAFMGKDELKRVYQMAIEHRYRFYSYGDAMLVI